MIRPGSPPRSRRSWPGRPAVPARRRAGPARPRSPAGCSSAASAPARSRWVNPNPASRSTRGSTRALVIRSLVTPPRAIDSTGDGMLSNAGRCSAPASAVVKAALVSGFGAVRFTGPDISWWSTRKRAARIQSSRLTQLMYWRARAELGAQAEPEQGQQPGQHPAVAGDHDPGAQGGHPDPRLPGRVGGGFPVPHHAGQEPAARRGRLVHFPAAGVPVPADGGTRQQDRGRLIHGRQELGERPGALHPAGPDLRPCRTRSSGGQRPPRRPGAPPRPCRPGPQAPGRPGGSADPRRSHCRTSGVRRTSVTTWSPPARSDAVRALPMSPEAPVTATFIAAPVFPRPRPARGPRLSLRWRRDWRMPLAGSVLAGDHQPGAYSPSSASKAPSSRRAFTVPRNRAASAPSTSRWS